MADGVCQSHFSNLLAEHAATGAEQGHNEGADDHPHGYDGLHDLQRRTFHQSRDTGAIPPYSLWIAHSVVWLVSVVTREAISYSFDSWKV